MSLPTESHASGDPRPYTHLPDGSEPTHRQRLRSLPRRVFDYLHERAISIFVSVVILVLTMVVLWPESVTTVPAGHAGVLYRRFTEGTVVNKVLKEGTHLILPWNSVTLYDLRVQIASFDTSVMTADSLESKMRFSTRYTLNPASVAMLHKHVGPNYLKVLIEPEITAQAKAIFAKFPPELAFTAARESISVAIRDKADRKLTTEFNPSQRHDVRYLTIEDVQVLTTELPPLVRDAVERKVREYNRAQAYEFTLKAEKLEAQRKAIEAQGIRDFQQTVQNGLTENYLRWRGIEATESLAASENAKILMFGSGPTGLPLVLGGLDGSGDVKSKGGASSRSNGKSPASGDDVMGGRVKNGSEFGLSEFGRAGRRAKPPKAETRADPVPSARAETAPGGGVAKPAGATDFAARPAPVDVPKPDAPKLDTVKVGAPNGGSPAANPRDGGRK